MHELYQQLRELGREPKAGRERRESPHRNRRCGAEGAALHRSVESGVEKMGLFRYNYPRDGIVRFLLAIKPPSLTEQKSNYTITMCKYSRYLELGRNTLYSGDVYRHALGPCRRTAEEGPS